LGAAAAAAEDEAGKGGYARGECPQMAQRTYHLKVMNLLRGSNIDIMTSFDDAYTVLLSQFRLVI